MQCNCTLLERIILEKPSVYLKHNKFGYHLEEFVFLLFTFSCSSLQIAVEAAYDNLFHLPSPIFHGVHLGDILAN